MVAALVACVVIPLVVGTALVAGDRAARPLGQHLVAAVGLAAAAVTAACVGITVVDRPRLDAPWVPAAGLRMHLGVDGISAPLLVLTAVLGVLVVLHAAAHPPHSGRHGTLVGSLLVVTGGALATFLARDAVLFFVAFELVLIPMWVLIKASGDPETRDGAAARFLLYTVLGSTLMLVGVLALVLSAGTAELDALAGGHHLNAAQQTLVAALLVIGLGIKVPLWPLHSWLPAAHTAAPTTGSVLLAGVLLKMGTYGLVRLVVLALPDGFARIAPVVGVAAVVSILWGGLACLAETGLKRLIAWSSVAHMGFVVLALCSGTALGIQAALLGNIAHGIVSALLFLVVGGLKTRWGGDDLADRRPAVRDTRPRLGFALVVGLAAALGLPGLAVFWGEALALYSAWSPAGDRPDVFFRVLTALAALGAVLAAGYALRVLRVVWAEGTGRPERRTAPVGAEGTPAAPETTVADDASRVETVVIGLLVAATVVLGVAPHLVLAVSEPDVIRLLGGAS